jgi:tetrahydromethanopterin S-methyltransferase subunit B
MIRWSIRNVQVRSRKLNEQIAQKLQEAHVVFVQMTEVQEQVQRGELKADAANQSLKQAMAIHESAMKTCTELMAERIKLFEPFVQKIDLK